MAWRLARAAAKVVQRPQQRIYLCEWYVKIVRPGRELPDDQVQCHVPMKMTKFDIKNYFERIYNVKIAKVNTRIQIGKVKLLRQWNVRKKRPDFKVAYLTLHDKTFQFPDLFQQQEQPNTKTETS